MTSLVNLADATVIKASNGFCVALADGRLPLEGDHPLGLYQDDCRYLRGHELWIAGRRPQLLIATDAAGDAAVFELTNPDLLLAGGQQLPLQSLRVRLERRIFSGAMVDRVSLRSHAREPVQFELQLRFDADFRPMLEVRGIVSPAEREVRCESSAGALRFSAIGLDGMERVTSIASAGMAADASGTLRVPVTLDPGEDRVLMVSFGLSGPVQPGADRPKPEHIDERPSVWKAGAEADAWLAEGAGRGGAVDAA